MDPVAFLNATSAAFVASPTAFVLTAALCFLAGFKWSSWLGAKHLKFAEAQVKEYKDKLAGASPDEAKARIERLEGRVEAMSKELDAAKNLDLVEVFEDGLKDRKIVLDGGNF